jgi:drug/metabolite transporter (DMT)-like permease
MGRSRAGQPVGYLAVGVSRRERMGGKSVLGLVLVVIGIISLAYQGITYTTQKKVVDLGPIQATKTEHHSIPFPPILGAIALIGGIILLVTDKR